MLIPHGRRRVVIDRVYPEIDCGYFPVKRVEGDEVVVWADAFADGHDAIRVVLRHRRRGGRWVETEMQPLGNDRYRASFWVGKPGRYEYTVCGWVDHFRTWRDGLAKKHAAGVETDVDLQMGAGLVAAAVARTAGEAGAAPGKKGSGTAVRLQEFEAVLRDDNRLHGDRTRAGISEELLELMDTVPDRSLQTDYPRTLRVTVDRERAAFSAWYEVFPRSASPDPGRHGTFRDLMNRLDYIAELGFDIVYLPPIHPIGHTKRKGKNNALEAGPHDPGSPWAIGSEEGGHTSIHPQLGTEEDFRALVAAAREYGMEIALDIAFQCSPDHPWVHEHPEWFVQRPDGTVQFAENPPKKYEDIYPLNFETEDWEALWEELKGVFEHWIELGVQVFRVDNPHTKAFGFWHWLVDDLTERRPELIFLSEAFTRPRRMYGLAKLGFTQSYTYFAWRNDPQGLRDYLTELTTTEVAEYFRPSFWPNTPDILHEDLQTAGRPAFMARYALAATLSSNVGIYGPAFELVEHTPREEGSEEYLNSEKYEIRYWELHGPGDISPFIRAVNRARRDNPALQRMRNLRFHAVDNANLLCYSKSTDDLSNVIFVVVNMDYHSPQAGWVEFSPAAVGRPHVVPFTVRDLLTDTAYRWDAFWNYVALDPGTSPVHLFRLEH
ncbi:MAG: alpha-1,4-glucan--maltose-1-phosphate maltosyltransferase [Spirochaetaceae bacterium]